VHPFIIAIPQITVAMFSLNVAANFLIMFIMIVYLISFLFVALFVYNKHYTARNRIKKA
jgi:hypothetical protein